MSKAINISFTQQHDYVVKPLKGNVPADYDQQQRMLEVPGLTIALPADEGKKLWDLKVDYFLVDTTVHVISKRNDTVYLSPLTRSESLRIIGEQ